MYHRLLSLFDIKGYGLFVVCMGLIGVAFSLSSPYLSLYCTGVIGMSTAAYGVLMAVNSLSGVFVNSWIAGRTDHGLDRKHIIIISALASACVYVVYLSLHNYFLLLVSIGLLAGIGAPAMPQIFASAREATMKSKSMDSTFATSTLRSLFSLGFLIGPLFGTVILAWAGYPGVFLGTSLLLISTAVLVFFLLKRQKAERVTFCANPSSDDRDSNLPTSGVADPGVADPGMKSAARLTRAGGDVPEARMDVRRPFIAFVLLFIVAFTYNLNTPLFIVHTLHAQPRYVGLVISTSAGLEIPIMIGLGAIAKRYSNHVLLIYGCVIAMVFYTILGLTSQLWVLFAIQILQASYIAIVMGIGLSYFQDILPDAPGVATTLYSNASSIGVLLGNLSGGAIAQFAGYRNVYWVSLGIVMVAFVILKSIKQPQPAMVADVTSQPL